MNYILIGQTPVPIDDIPEWARWFETVENRIIKQDEIRGVTISTVFLGLDHNLMNALFPGAAPLLFETMIFGDPLFASYQMRYSTWLEAEAGHAKAVDFVLHECAKEER